MSPHPIPPASALVRIRLYPTPSILETISTIFDKQSAMHYAYAPLTFRDSIRLLTLSPASTVDDDIVISLEEARLSSTPHFNALSYTWATEDGDACSNWEISCDDKCLMNTRSCGDALRRIRKRDEPTVLWIDSICINQKDNNEKSAQVGLMRDVYKGALEVLIWLGHAAAEIDTASGDPVSSIFLEYISRMAVELRALRKDKQDPSSSPSFSALRSQLSEAVMVGTQTAITRGLWDIERRRWWQRVWVVQEATLAQSATIICGNSEVEYSALFEWFHVVFEDYHRESWNFWEHMGAIKNHMIINYGVQQARSKLDRSMTRSVSQTSAEKVLGRSRRLKATDARGHIFGVYGILDDFKEYLPTADYNISLSSLFGLVTRRLIEQANSLTILGQVCFYGAEHDLPSWVPHWSARPLHHLLITTGVYHAAATSCATYKFSDDEKTLSVTGVLIDRINDLPKVANQSAYYMPYEAERCIPGIRLSLQTARRAQTLNEGITEETLWRTICWNVDGAFNYPAPPATGDLFSRWSEILSDDSQPVQRTKDMLHEEAPDYNDIFVHSMPLGITAQNRLVSVPWTAEEGDHIALIGGADTPFVLRSTGNHFRVIGLCYLHGAMDGEMYSRDKEKLRTLVLC